MERPTNHIISVAQLAERLSFGFPGGRIPGSEAMAHAAVAMIFRDGSDGAEVLMVRRAEHPADPWSGHMAFPGGRVEATDESYEAAAIRETREEVGIDLPACARALGRLSELQARSRQGLLPLCIHPFVYELTACASVSLNHEIQETLWIPLRLFADPACREAISVPDDPRGGELPACRYQGRVVWGLSLKMLDDLLAPWRLSGHAPEKAKPAGECFGEGGDGSVKQV
ncbi:MAG: CoA pyrophosphatase [Verrucomicrobia bacterium]|nr:MAG: CoA pyrophosphatase [Verrucomicrobiota bacterium]